MNELILLEDLGMIYPTEKSNAKRHYALYKCFCGNEFKTRVQYIKNNHTKSCGCLRGINHNLSNHRLYRTWNAMIERCFNKTNPNYKNYGGRGITVCDEWLDIKAFINDMFPTYIEGLTLDRINPNSNYEKNNCRWATKTTQSRNTKRLRTDNTSGYRGVSLNNIKWTSQIHINGKKIHIGCFDTALEGALAYDKYIIDNKLGHTRNFR